MSKIIGMDTPGMQPANNKQTKIDISNSVPLTCSNCGYDVFISGVKIRKLSKFNFGGDNDMLIPFDVLLCGECGEVNKETLPPEVKALEMKDKYSETN
jgi:hypothetical protein